jgi:hypothetical protein
MTALTAAPEHHLSEPAPGAAPVVPTPDPQWGLAKRVWFRFFCIYFASYIVPFPFESIPGSDKVLKPLSDAVDATVLWVGAYVFGTEITVRPNGSGDTTWDYVRVFSLFTIACLVTACWSFLDRKRASYPRLFQGLRIWVRFYVAAIMISYGAAKVIKSQFPNPSLDRLIQPFGDASPMGLLWAFMGASTPYNFFTGAGEMLGGLLLTTRRTTLLGALVSFAVMSHVAMLNFSYDVPVKLFSTHLLAMAIFLAAPDLGTLCNVFVLHRAGSPLEYRPSIMRWRPLRYGALAARTALVLAFTGMALFNAQESRKRWGELAPRSPLYGVWTVEEFDSDGKSRPPLITDTGRWRRVVFDYPTMVAVQLMSDSRNRYGAQLDEEQKLLVLSKFDDKAWKSELAYSEPEPGVLVLEGTFEQEKIRARLRRVDTESFRLTNRGFHWINEYPFNR